MKVVLGILGIIVAVALIIAAWFGYWALAEANQTARYKVNTNGQQYQSGLVSQERDRIAAFDIATVPAHKEQIRTTFCQVFLTLKPAPEDLIQANARICF